MVPEVLLLFVGLVPCFQGADPVYSPQTLSDSAGNQADSSSKITWADLPSGQPYLVSNPSRVTAGLEPYYNLMHSFINSVFMKGFPDEIVEKAIDGEYTYVINNYSSYITNFLGFAICVAVGILFIIIFPIVGCCFCCCRLCGKCGGKRQQLQKDADNTCRKYTFISILFVSTTFVLVGSICIYINNNNMTTMLNSIPDITEDNLADIKTYTSNTVEEAKHIISTNFQFVKSALFRDLDNVAYLAGLPLKTNIKDSTNLGATLTSAYSLASNVDAIDASLTSVENNLTALEASITNLDTALTAVKSSLNNIFATCGGACPGPQPDYSGATLDIDSSSFPDLSSARANMNDAIASNLTAKIVDAEKELDDIPNTVATEANSTINTMKTTINDLSDNLDGVLDQVTNINSMLSGSNATVDLDKYSNMVKDAKNTIEKYDKYRWYGGVALSSLTLLVVVFVVLGLLFGIFGTSVSTPTHQRGCVSNCGGTFLIASVALVFIFSSLLMLLTTIPFIPGAPIHKVLCEPITNLELLQKYLNMFEKKQVGEGKYWLAKMILSNDTIPLTFNGVLQDCKDGKSVFTAFKLDSKFDLTDMLNYSKTLNVQSEIDGVNVDLSSITVYPASLQTQLNDVKDAVNINFAQFYTELGANVTTANLSALADELDTYAASGIPAPHNASLEAEATRLRNIESAEYAYVKANVTALNTSLSEMETTVSSIPDTVDALDSGLTAADNYIKNNASTVVKSILSSFANRLLGIIDSFIAYTDSAVKNQLGSCEPVWNIYNSLLVHTFCYNFMDCLNGFWFSIGWVVFFFLPSVIFSVKAAKYFRQTEMPSEDDCPPPYTDAEKNPQDFTSQHPMPSKAQFWMRNNKVGHKDSLEGCGTSTTDHFGKHANNVSTEVPPNLYQENDHVVEKDNFHVMIPYSVSAMENKTVDTNPTNPTTKSLLHLNHNESTNPEHLEHLEQRTGLNDNQSVSNPLTQSIEDTPKAPNTIKDTELETNQNHELNGSNKNENLTDFNEIYPSSLIVSEAALSNTFENIKPADEKEESFAEEVKETNKKEENVTDDVKKADEINESVIEEVKEADEKEETVIGGLKEAYENNVSVTDKMKGADENEVRAIDKVKEAARKEGSIIEEVNEAYEKEVNVVDEVKKGVEKEVIDTDKVYEAGEKEEHVNKEVKVANKKESVTEEVKESDAKEDSVTKEHATAYDIEERVTKEMKEANDKEESVTEEVKETNETKESVNEEAVKEVNEKEEGITEVVKEADEQQESSTDKVKEADEKEESNHEEEKIKLIKRKKKKKGKKLMKKK